MIWKKFLLYHFTASRKTLCSHTALTSILTQFHWWCSAQQREKSNFCQSSMSKKPSPIRQTLDKEHTPTPLPHPHLCMLYSIRAGKRHSVLFQVLGSYTTHVKAQQVTCQRYNPMLSYMMGQSQISNIGAGEWDTMPSQKTQLTAGSAWLVSMTLDDMGEKLSPREISHPFFTIIYSKFPIL